jgi:hypothetical protein
MTGETNWTPYDLRQLMGILDEDLSGAWDQVNAWFNAQAMLDEASANLSDARAKLAAVWPPESSPAAQTFFATVDQLTDSMTKTSAASNANANALAMVLDNQSTTQSKVNDLHSAWQTYQRLAYTNDPDFPAAQWQAGLNTEAQAHMAAADKVIAEYATALVVPPVIPVPTITDTSTVIGGNDGSDPPAGGGSVGGTGGWPGGTTTAPTGPSGGSPGSGPIHLPGSPILTGGGPPSGAPTGPGGPGIPPVGPIGPGGPGGPGGPAGPGGPIAHGQPVLPVLPGLPGDPSGPGSPVSPGRPGIPEPGGEPGRPAGPIGRTSAPPPDAAVGFPGSGTGPGADNTGLTASGGRSAGGITAEPAPAELLPGRGWTGGGRGEQPLGASGDRSDGGLGGVAAGDRSVVASRGGVLGDGVIGGGMIGGGVLGDGARGSNGRRSAGVAESGTTDHLTWRGQNIQDAGGTLRPPPRELAPTDESARVPGSAEGTLRPRPPPDHTLGATGFARGDPGQLTGTVRSAGSEGAIGSMTSGSVGTRSRRRGRRSLTDRTWAVPSGGPAVLSPDGETDVHDPGPGVIGIDR